MELSYDWSVFVSHARRSERIFVGSIGTVYLLLGLLELLLERLFVRLWSRSRVRSAAKM